jgi:probable rRNA maturation factor
VIIDILDRQTALKFSLDSVKKIVKAVLKEEGESCDELSIHFVDKAEITKLHADYFNDPTPTDCISFPIDEEEEASPYRLLGEVFVCPETAIEYAQKHKGDPYEETKLYLIHGLLHLMGYDDIEEADRQEMRNAEERHLQRLKRLNVSLLPN